MTIVHLYCNNCLIGYTTIRIACRTQPNLKHASLQTITDTQRLFNRICTHMETLNAHRKRQRPPSNLSTQRSATGTHTSKHIQNAIEQIISMNFLQSLLESL